jgi:diguanylate cyclase (GGDEF)-like protein/PAS domain S-box-containing protein
MLFLCSTKKGRLPVGIGGAKLFGYKRTEIIGKNFSLLFTKEDVRRGSPASDMKNAVSEGRHLDERRYIRKNKTIFWSSGVLTSTRDKNGTSQGFSKIMRDVTLRNELHLTAVHNSTHDFLTGLPNRIFFEESFIEEIHKTKKGNLLAILYLDFNNFKRTNDEQGHRFGDLVLIEIADRLSHAVRGSDMAARFGGDEFVVLAKQLENPGVAIRIARKILRAFDTPIIIEKKTIKTSVSIGISLYPTDGKRPADLLRFSDMALYQAKKGGGNQMRLYTKNSSGKKYRT